MEIKTWNTPGRKRMRLRKPTETLIQPVRVYMSRLGKYLKSYFSTSNISHLRWPSKYSKYFPTCEAPSNISHLRWPSKYSWLQPRGVTAACMAGPRTKPMVCKGQVNYVRRKNTWNKKHLEKTPGITRESTTVRFSPLWRLLQPHKLDSVPRKFSAKKKLLTPPLTKLADEIPTRRRPANINIHLNSRQYVNSYGKLYFSQRVSYWWKYL